MVGGRRHGVGRRKMEGKKRSGKKKEMWGAGTRHRNAPERTSHSADTEDIQQEESFTVGTESWRGEQGGTECALIPLYSLAFHVPLPDTIPLLHGLTSHLTQEEHIGYITATKLEQGLCRSQGGNSCYIVDHRSSSPFSFSGCVQNKVHQSCRKS